MNVAVVGIAVLLFVGMILALVIWYLVDVLNSRALRGADDD